MRISWGFKITVLYVGFVALILSMVSMAMRQKIDLVSTDYYEQELKYQDKINKIDRAHALENPLTWEVKQGLLILKFPEQFKGQKINGSIYFFRPSDASLDKTIPIPADSASVQNISTQELKKGLYKVQISWGINNKEFYNEGIIQIN